jgi:hypothetical protein
MRDEKEAGDALKTWHDAMNDYIDDESFLDDLENAVLGDIETFEQYYGAQLSTVNGVISPDLLVNIFMMELKDTDQIREFLLAELNIVSKRDELSKVFCIASGFEDDEISSGRRDYSIEVNKCTNFMTTWSTGVKDESRFRTMVLDRLINRIFIPENIEVDENYTLANAYANAVVYKESEKLR